MSNLSVYIIEDDKMIIEKFKDSIKEKDDIILIGYSNDASVATNEILSFRPDVVIADLELHLGKGSGLDVLSNISSSDLSKKPYIMVTTNNSSQRTYEYARQLGADYILYKHQSDYSEEYVISFILQLKDIINSSNMSLSANIKCNNDTIKYQSAIRSNIIHSLNSLNFSNKHNGYTYLIDAIELIIQGDSNNYEDILSRKYKKTKQAIVHDMKYAIDYAWKTANQDDLFSIYTARISRSDGTPTVLEFIYFFANKFKN